MCVPKEMAAAGEAFLRWPAIDEARRIHFSLSPLFAALFYETNPIPVKEALGMMGKIDPELRLPLCANGNRQPRSIGPRHERDAADLDHPS